MKPIASCERRSMSGLATPPGSTDLTPVLNAIATNDADVDTAIANLATSLAAVKTAGDALAAQLAKLTLKAV